MKIKKLIRNIGLIIIRVLQNFGFKIIKINNDAFFDQFKILSNKEKVLFFDVGSNRGQTIDEYNKYFKNINSYFSIEPITELIEAQKKKYSKNKEIIFIDEILASRIDSFNFNINFSTDTSSILTKNEDFIPERYGDILNSKEATIKISNTIDNLVAKYDLEVIDILKLDVQGAELEVLKGAEKSLKQRKITIIYCECLYVPFYINQNSISDLIGYLFNLGYKFVQSYNFEFNNLSGKLLCG